MFVKDGKSNHASGGAGLGAGLWKNLFKSTSSRADDTISILKGVPLFQGMSDSDLRIFEKILHQRQFRLQEAIFRRNEPGAGMYIIRSGSVAVYVRDAENKRQELAKLSRGDFFGEIALLDESPRPATAVALEKTKILGLFRPELLSFIERQPQLGCKFLTQLSTVLAERLKATTIELEEMRRASESGKIIT